MNELKISKSNFFYLVAVGIVFVFFKLIYKNISIDDLKLFLLPIDFIISISTDGNSFFVPNEGYFHPNINILINKSCSGFNLWMISFLICSFIVYSSKISLRNKLLNIPVSLIIAYIFMVIANSFRISNLIKFETVLSFALPFNENITHELIGVLTNLTFLLLFYTILNHYKPFIKKI